MLISLLSYGGLCRDLIAHMPGMTGPTSAVLHVTSQARFSTKRHDLIQTYYITLLSAFLCYSIISPTPFYLNKKSPSLPEVYLFRNHPYYPFLITTAKMNLTPTHSSVSDHRKDKFHSPDQVGSDDPCMSRDWSSKLLSCSIVDALLTYDMLNTSRCCSRH